MKRIYTSLVQKHPDTQMLFLTGPRQVGKTTIAQQLQEKTIESVYLNWDVTEDRASILQGTRFIENMITLNKARTQKPLIVFDELHKHKDWKNFIKGFYDLYKRQLQIIVTGSARLDVYRHANDSLMGRYLLYRVHPLSVGELAHTEEQKDLLYAPLNIGQQYEALQTFGGYPDPFLRQDQRYHQQWGQLRHEQLFHEDLVDLTNIQERKSLEVLALFLKNQVGGLVNRSSLGQKIQVTHQTIGRWMNALEYLYYCFFVPPWSNNIPRSLIKEPKIYLWDWSLVTDTGQRFENFVASHLLKAVQYWTDRGDGMFRLYFIRDKEQKEVDFLITKNEKPWILVEAKETDTRLSKSLVYFQEITKAPFAFQVVNKEPYVDMDCFSLPQPVVVPGRTFLSQLI